MPYIYKGKEDIDNVNLVFFDLETTGLNALCGDAICEIGALKVRQRNVIAAFYSLINPKRPIPHEAYNVHKISDADVQNAPYFEGIADKFFSFLDDSVICAYNIPFDRGFINHELTKNKYPPLALPMIDILVMARKILQVPRYSLSSISRFFCIEDNDQMHRALTDAFLAYKIFFNLYDMIKDKEPISLQLVIQRFGAETIDKE